MKVRRASLVQHLQKIICNGQVTEAVFTDGFATQAFTPDQLLLVLAPSLPKVEPLEDEIGMADLATIIKAFGWTPGEGNETIDVSVRVEDHRLVIDEEQQGAVHRLMTASPKTIGTRIEQSTVDKLLAKEPKATGKGIQLTRALIEGIRNTYAGIKAAEVELVIGPKGGKVRVGNENGHYSEFESKDLKDKQSYSLLFGEHLVDVLGQITDYGTASLQLRGPKAFIVIKAGEYRYFLSPRAKSADEKDAVAEEKPAKGKGGSKAKGKGKGKTAEESGESVPATAGAEAE